MKSNKKAEPTTKKANHQQVRVCSTTEKNEIFFIIKKLNLQQKRLIVQHKSEINTTKHVFFIQQTNFNVKIIHLKRLNFILIVFKSFKMYDYYFLLADQLNLSKTSEIKGEK